MLHHPAESNAIYSYGQKEIKLNWDGNLGEEAFQTLVNPNTGNICQFLPEIKNGAP